MKETHRVLIVDDEDGIRFALRDFLESSGFAVEEAGSCAEAEKVFRASRPDAALLDFRLPDGNALDLIPKLKAQDSTVPVIVLTAHASIDLAVRAIQQGAEQFLTKPVELPALLVILQRALDNQRIRRKDAAKARGERPADDPFLGESAAIRALADQARRSLASESPDSDPGRNRIGKRGACALDAPERHAARRGVRRPELRGPLPGIPGVASCSATRRARSPERFRANPVSSRSPTGARCSSTRSATSISRFSRSS